MIVYDSGAFGFHVLFRLHGSAVFKALLPSLISTVAYVIFFEALDLHDADTRLFDHPYPMAALLVAFSFLLTFKMGFSYNRYWEAMTAVHQMHSKWLDAGMELASFHYQSSGYNKPPAFGDHPEITELLRERERLEEPTMAEMEEQIDKISAETGADNMSLRSRFKLGRTRGSMALSKEDIVASAAESDDENEKDEEGDEQLEKTEEGEGATQKGSSGKLEEGERNSKEETDLGSIQDAPSQKKPYEQRKMAPPGESNEAADPKEGPKKPSVPTEREEENKVVSFLAGTIFGHKPKVARRTIAKGMMPSLFLQEAAHLLSLLSAVAMSTLRNDIEHAESPLACFYPNEPWPAVDPDSMSADVRKDWARSSYQTYTVARYVLGLSRNDKSRTLYNAARPMRVVGGISDAEVKALQAAKGPLAKVALCSMWWQEFLSREYLAGSTGKVAPPIISRLYQFTSDGMLGYNHARQIAYIPFPFPHSQITSLYIIVVIVLIPTLMLSYVNNEVYGAILNFLTVLCFTGFYEVARELENPFINVPNDIPLNNFQAQFNEALMCMYAGYHPESFWEIEGEKLVPKLADEGEDASPAEAAFVVK